MWGLYLTYFDTWCKVPPKEESKGSTVLHFLSFDRQFSLSLFECPPLPPCAGHSSFAGMGDLGAWEVVGNDPQLTKNS